MSKFTDAIKHVSGFITELSGKPAELPANQHTLPARNYTRVFDKTSTPDEVRNAELINGRSPHEILELFHQIGKEFSIEIPWNVENFSEYWADQLERCNIEPITSKIISESLEHCLNEITDHVRSGKTGDVNLNINGSDLIITTIDKAIGGVVESPLDINVFAAHTIYTVTNMDNDQSFTISAIGMLHIINFNYYGINDYYRVKGVFAI